MYDELVRCLRGHSQKMGCADNCICADAYKRGFETCSEELAKLAADAIEELSKKRDAACWGCKCNKIERNKWIPVTERLPEESGSYLIVDGKLVMEGLYEKDWVDFPWTDPGEMYMTYHPTHWMPLPQPPESEDE